MGAFAQITRFILSKKPNLLLLKFAAILAILFLCIYFWRRRSRHEGFETGEAPLFTQKYTLKRNGDIYDDFYARVYSATVAPSSLIDEEINAIIHQTQPSQESSVFLDVCARDGAVVAALQSQGFKQVYGLEKNLDKMSAAPKKCSSDNLACADAAENALSFDRATFTHILCLDPTHFYQMDDRIAFFRNAHYWLQPSGYLICRIANRPELNRAQPVVLHAPGFQYSRNYIAEKTDGDYTIRETFVGETGVREQETTLHVPNAGDVLNDAIYSGFVIAGKTRLETDEGRGALYFFQKVG